MTGGIWFVQAVHYPLFAQVPAAGFAAYEKGHYKRVLPLVVSVALGELVTAFLLGPNFRLNTVLLSATWIMTFLVQLPLHGKLRQGFHSESHQRLISSNRWRVGAWTLRLLILGYSLWSSPVHSQVAVEFGNLGFHLQNLPGHLEFIPVAYVRAGRLNFE